MEMELSMHETQTTSKVSNTGIFAAALKYAEQGFHVLPLKPRSKEGQVLKFL